MNNLTIEKLRSMAFEASDEDQSNFLHGVADAMLAAQSAALVQIPDVDDLANFIRFTDGNHKMGAGALAERIVDWLSAPSAAQSAPAGGREAFEAFARDACRIPAHIPVNWEAQWTQQAWEGWQAGASWQRTQSVPAGEREAFQEAATGFSLPLDESTHRGTFYEDDRTFWMHRGWQARAAWQRTQSAGVPEGWRLVGYTTAGMLAIAEQLPLTGRIGARCKADERWNVPLYSAPAQPAAQGDDTPSEGWPAYHKRKMTTMLDLMRGLRDRYKVRLAAAQGQGEVQRLREAAQKVISHVEGDLPIKGWLRDNDASRKALGDLRACLAASTGQENKP